ncbi:MAG: YlmH/Sll1252 family protein [Clostridiales bacterium]|nr:YlmH/Sll1252 family protein [Clostridiales bacterium]HBM79824.1 RNA-binding protein [Clostridiaceae bacterium]
MDKRTGIIKYFNSPEDKEFASKIIDTIEQARKNRDVKYTQFLDPAQIKMAEKIIEQFDGIKYTISSGIENCERNIIAVYPDYASFEEIKLPLDAICISYNTKFEKIGHRDVLGAIMSLGIKREKVGDIFFNDNRCFIVVYKDISYYVLTNMTKIKHTPVKAEYIDFKDIKSREYEYKDVMSNVASLRLDSVLSSGFGESRRSISNEILNGNVKVNWEVTEEPHFIVQEGDTISLRGRGRIILYKVLGTTKKGRINILIKKVI